MKNKKLLLIIVLFIAVGFATVTTTLLINGGVKISANIEDFDIYFSEAILNNEDVSKTVLSPDGKRISYEDNKVLTEKGDKTILEYKVINNSRNYDATVEVECSGFDTEYVAVTNDINPVIHSKEIAPGTLTVEYIKKSTDEIDIELNVNY